jgi:hypothetical protein
VERSIIAFSALSFNRNAAHLPENAGENARVRPAGPRAVPYFFTSSLMAPVAHAARR